MWIVDLLDPKTPSRIATLVSACHLGEALQGIVDLDEISYELEKAHFDC